MKTLLQINTVANYGSTGRIVEEIGQLAIAQGWKSYIAYGRNVTPSKSELIKIGNNWDITMHGIQTRLFDRHGLASKKATSKFTKKIETINPDIIHLHNIHGYYLNIEILFKFLKKSNIPVIWTLHDCWPITGHCVHFDLIGCKKWEIECYKCPQKTTYPATYFIDRSKKNFKFKSELFLSLPNLTIVTVSNWLANIIKKSFLNNTPIKTIYNGINLNIFQPFYNPSIRQKYKLENKFIILGVANIWSQQKGLSDFIEISNKLKHAFQIILVGLNEMQIKSLPKNIIGIKRTESVEELAQLYATSDVFVNPTYEDNFPTTNIESLACGTPVITYQTGGSIEAINKESGIIIEKGNIYDLIEAIKHISQRGKKFYFEACIKRANKYFNKEDRFNEYLRLYNNSLDNIK